MLRKSTSGSSPDASSRMESKYLADRSDTDPAADPTTTDAATAPTDRINARFKTLPPRRRSGNRKRHDAGAGQKTEILLELRGIDRAILCAQRVADVEQRALGVD